MPDYSYRQPSGSQDAYLGQADSPQSSYQPPPAFSQQRSYGQHSDYGRSNSDNGRADAGLEGSGGCYSRPNAESDRVQVDNGRGGVGNGRGPPGAYGSYPERNTRGIEDSSGYLEANRGPPEGSRGYPERSTRGAEDNSAYTQGSRGYPENNQGYGRPAMMPAGLGLNNATAQLGAPSAADAKKAAYRYASLPSKWHSYIFCAFVH